MKLRYIGTRARAIAAPGRDIRVQPGDVFEVGERLGRALLRQTRRFERADLDPPPETTAAGDPDGSAEVKEADQ